MVIRHNWLNPFVQVDYTNTNAETSYPIEHSFQYKN